MKPITLPTLPYHFNDLEPVISAEIMKLHYEKHHQAYVNNLNTALAAQTVAEANGDIATLINLQPAIRFNGGGHLNHSLFWQNLIPVEKGGGQLPQGDLKKAIQEQFGSLEKLIEEMTTKTVAIQGSGWGWLGYEKSRHRLCIATCDNQDPLSTKGLIPLLGIDVWEHAYYLQYKNMRADYVKAIWGIIHWQEVAHRYDQAKS